MYDLNSFEDSSYIEGLCLANLPIDFYGKKLHHITVKDLLIMGEKKYSDLIIPFCLTKEALFEGDLGEIDIFEIITHYKFSHYLDSVIEVLKMLFKTDDVVPANMGESVEIVIGKGIDDSLFVDKYKFKELSELILKMCNAEKIKKRNNEKEERTLTLEQINSIKNKRERDYQMAIYKKNQKKNEDKNKSMALYNVYNYVCNNEIVDYEKPLRFNVYQLYNTFNISHKKDEHKYTMRILTSGMCSDTKKLDLRPLSQQIVK